VPSRSGDCTSGSFALSTIGRYARPTTLADALALLSRGEVRILAGGTDFYPSLAEDIPCEPVVDISALKELSGVACSADQIRIGGLTTWTDLIRAPLPPCFAALKAAARELGSVQIQNRGTIAGNLCNASPAADGVPPLLALDAEVELTSQMGTRHIPLAEFIVGNRKTQRRADELLTAVLVPRRVENAGSAFLKLGARHYLVISIVMVGAVVLVDDAGHVADARVAVGACSAVAQRLRGLESELVGASVRDGLGARVRREHLRLLTPISDVRATADYRMDAALTLVQRTLNLCAGNAE